MPRGDGTGPGMGMGHGWRHGQQGHGQGRGFGRCRRRGLGEAAVEANGSELEELRRTVDALKARLDALAPAAKREEAP